VNRATRPGCSRTSSTLFKRHRGRSVPSTNPETSQSIKPRTISCSRTRSLAPGVLEGRDFVQLTKLADGAARIFDRHQSSQKPVVQIGGVVGDLIAQIDELRFERRAQAGQIFLQLWKLPWREIA
jgi:hypothetical protein